MTTQHQQQKRRRRGAPWTEAEDQRLLTIAHLPPRAIADTMRRTWLACRRRLVYLRVSGNELGTAGKAATSNHRDAIIRKEVPVDIYELKVGDRVKTIDGSIAEILNETADGRWILVRYIEVHRDPDLVGTEDLCDEDELVEMVAS